MGKLRQGDLAWIRGNGISQPEPPPSSLHQASSKTANWRCSLAVCSLGTPLSGRALPPSREPEAGQGLWTGLRVLHPSRTQRRVLPGRRGATHLWSCSTVSFSDSGKGRRPPPSSQLLTELLGLNSNPPIGPPNALRTQSSLFWHVPWARACPPPPPPV